MTRNLNYKNTHQKNKKNRGEIKQERICKSLNFLLVGLIMIVSGYYAATVNDLTVKGLKIQELKQEVNEKQERNRNLTVRASSLKSYQNLVKRTDDLDMTKAQEIEYIKVLRKTVAKK